MKNSLFKVIGGGHLQEAVAVLNKLGNGPQGGESLGKFGYSKDDRPDRRQMIVGAVLTGRAGRCAAS